MNKKGLFAIVLFIAVGLFMFTFANPNDRVREGQGSEGSSETTTPASDTEVVDNNDTNDNQPVVTPVVRPAVDNQNDNQPVVNPTPAPVVIDLTNDKNAAKEEITNYAAKVDLDEEIKNSLVDDAFTKIDNATTKEDIDTIVEDTKKALDDAAKEELDAYKDAAKDEINEYAKGIDLEGTKKEEIITDAFTKIDNAATKEEVDGIVENSKKALDDAAKAELDAYKANAKEELTNYATNVELNGEVKEAKVSDGNDAIDAASNKAEVDSALANAKKALDDAAKAELDAYKTDAKEELTNYAANVELNSEVKETKVSNGNDAIDAATKKAEVDNALANAKKALDDAAKAELDAYKANAKEELTNYATNVELNSEVKEEKVSNGNDAIDAATTKAEVDSALANAKKALDDAAKAELDAYKTDAKEELTNYATNVELNSEVKEAKVSDGNDAIDAAKTKAEVDSALANAKKALDDAAKAELDAYKANAKTELNNYGNLGFSTENANVVAGYKTNGVNAITAATTKAEVDSALANAKALIDEVVEIKLNGDATVTIVEGMTYTDASVTVVSTKYTVKDVKVNSNVNNRVVGNYKVTYTINNAERVLLASATRNVNVIARAMTGIALRLSGTDTYSNDLRATYVEGLVSNITMRVYKAFNDNTYELMEESIEKCKTVWTGIFTSKKVCTHNEGYKVSGSFDGKNITDGKTITYTYSENNNMKATFTYVIEAKSILSIVPEKQVGTYKVDALADTIKATVNYNNNTKDVVNCKINNFNSSVEGSFNTTMTCAGQEFAYSYTVAYTKDQIQAKASNVDLELYNSDNSVEFHNLGILTVKKVEQVHIAFWDGKETLKRTITLGEGTDKFYLNDKDYDTLRSNNSFFDGNYIKVTYVYNSIEVTEYYSEIFGYTF